MATLTPAYGRDYTSAKAAEADYLKGRDFVLNDAFSPWDGKPCSCRDFPGQEVKIRYNRRRNTVLVTYTPRDIELKGETDAE